MGSSTIDYVAVPSCLSNQVIRCEVLCDQILNTSDHYVVRVSLDLECDVYPSTKTTHSPRVKWSKVKSDILLNRYTRPVEEYVSRTLDSITWDNVTEDMIDAVIDDVNIKMSKSADNLPKSKFRKHIRPFWNSNLTELKKIKVARYHEWKLNGKPKEGDIWTKHKNAKKRFRSEIKFVQQEYERKEIEETVRCAEVDRNKFWRRIKKSRKPKAGGTSSIRNAEGKVVHETKDVIRVWHEHFSNLCKENVDEGYDDDHYHNITTQVRQWATEKDAGPFLNEYITSIEVTKAINKLNKGKAPGHDNISAEHLQNAGKMIYDLLAGLFNRIIHLEYIPQNFRIGTQIPLYKGKNSCALDPNNYRGITLLTSLNKVFEIIMWRRLEVWWEEEGVISPLQGACKAGVSCIHSALVLQETIAVNLDTSTKVFVAYFDVAKAFDSVWIDGLFYHLRAKGITGKCWRLLYRSYQNFLCRVRIEGQFSDWYTMSCGIHQGGFLSLLKYTAFIDPLIRELEHSDVGCTIVGVPTTPVGYADDMATCSTSKPKMDKALSIVSEHAKRWRYRYNNKKSAVMVYGENRSEYKKGSRYRSFKLSQKKVNECTEYDHVGVKNCLFKNYMPRTEDRIMRGRRAFNAITNVGIKKKGLPMKVCANLFWSIIIPIVTYGSEVWTLRGDEIEALRKFQRYVGRRCQRFNSRSPNYSAYVPLGWLSINRYVQVKKLLFLRTITIMKDECLYKKILQAGAARYNLDRNKGMRNENDSPIFDLLNVCREVGIFDTCMNTIENGHYFSKEMWRSLVWSAVWSREDNDVHISYTQLAVRPRMFDVIDKPYYLSWWIMSDNFHKMTGICEKMAALVCGCSMLKSHDLKLKRKSHWSRCCSRCNLSAIEDPWHIIMQCPFYCEYRNDMYSEVEHLNDDVINEILNDPSDVFNVLMGKHPPNACMEDMIKIWSISGKHICRMYDSAAIQEIV